MQARAAFLHRLIYKQAKAAGTKHMLICMQAQAARVIHALICRLKLRELLMPKIVNTSDPELQPARMGKQSTKKSWEVNPDLFPCELPEALQTEADEAVQVRCRVQFP